MATVSLDSLPGTLLGLVLAYARPSTTHPEGGLDSSLEELPAGDGAAAEEPDAAEEQPSRPRNLLHRLGRAASAAAASLRGRSDTPAASSPVPLAADLALVDALGATSTLWRDRLRDDVTIWQSLNRNAFQVDDENGGGAGRPASFPAPLPGAGSAPSSSSRHGTGGHWPQLSSPRQLHRILAIYAPLEGFYVLQSAFPYGLLLILRFRDGRFVGELVGHADGCNGLQGPDGHLSNARTTVLSVAFDDDDGNGGETETTTWCGYRALCYGGAGSPDHIQDVSGGVLGQRNVFEVGTVRKLIEPFSPTRDDLLVRVEITTADGDAREDAGSHFGPGPAVSGSAWNPINSTTAPTDLVASLLSLGRGGQHDMCLSYIDGPSAIRDFVVTPDMPLMRPGLYCGAYDEMYGKFRHGESGDRWVTWRRSNGLIVHWEPPLTLALPPSSPPSHHPSVPPSVPSSFPPSH